MRFDIEKLKARASDKRYQRAMGYLERGGVEILDLKGGVVSAHVQGTETYLVEMGEPDGSDARCTCPDVIELSPVCKHIIGVALVVNDLGEAGLHREAQRFARLREGLGLNDREMLIETIIDLAKRHPDVLRRLEGDDDDDAWAEAD